MCGLGASDSLKRRGLARERGPAFGELGASESSLKLRWAQLRFALRPRIGSCLACGLDGCLASTTEQEGNCVPPFAYPPCSGAVLRGSSPEPRARRASPGVRADQPTKSAGPQHDR